MNHKILFYFLSPFFLHAYTISSSFVDFNGAITELNGNVSFVQEELKIQSDQATIEKSETAPFLKKAELKHNVMIKIPPHGTILCDFSILDFEKKEGYLKMTQDKVLYKGEILFRNQLHPITCRCKNAFFTLNHQEKRNFFISKLFLNDDLEVDIDADFTLFADRAVVIFDDSSQKNYPANIELFSAKNRLQLNYPNGQIKTNYLKLHLNEDFLEFGKIDGTINYLGSTEFSCEHFIFHQDKKIAKLTGPIFLDNKEQGNFKTDSPIIIERFDPMNLPSLKSITISGAFELNYKNHQLKSASGCKIDHSKKQILISSKSEEKSIYYRFNDLTILSDSLSITYQENLNEVEKVEFSGNVLMQMDQPFHSLQSALAHRIVFHPETQKIEIHPNQGEKILFWTQDEELALTAERIEISIDPITKKKKCKTFGIIKSKVLTQDLFSK
jgi:lipopolysaccharide export system protein LptA